ncbi:MAG TPA: hypothetical protein VHZ97_29455 [Pseudonocardiaceae bacterium]|nr:hypothetical protein [Pseudonocardiaceae bacterium]
MDTDRTARQLRLIGEITSLAERIGVEVWLRGGWAVDFTLGEVTRDHRDIDWFMWTQSLPKLRAALDEHGFQPDPVADETAQYDVTKDGEDLQFALLARGSEGNPVVAGGSYAGEPWPADLLDGESGRIGEQRCPVVNPRAQIEIKQMMPIWVPGMPRRAKDAEDIARLEAR